MHKRKSLPPASGLTAELPDWMVAAYLDRPAHLNVRDGVPAPAAPTRSAEPQPTASSNHSAPTPGRSATHDGVVVHAFDFLNTLPAAGGDHVLPASVGALNRLNGEPK